MKRFSYSKQVEEINKYIDQRGLSFESVAFDGSPLLANGLRKKYHAEIYPTVIYLCFSALLVDLWENSYNFSPAIEIDSKFVENVEISREIFCEL